MQISYVSAPAGSGKTYSILNHIAAGIDSGSNYILAQPTIALSHETMTDFRKRFPHIAVTTINSDTASGSVRKRLVDYMKAPYPEPHILFTTWAGISESPSLSNRSNWKIVIAEIPVVERMFDRPLPKGHAVITNHLLMIPEGKYARLAIKAEHEGHIRQLAENRCKDDMHEVVRDLANTLYSEHWESFVNHGSYNNLLSNAGMNRLQVHSLLKPSVFNGFKSVTIMGACFEDSLLYQTWSKEVGFVPLDLPLRYNEHQNGRNLTIRYCFNGSFSKHKLKGEKVQERILSAVDSVYSGSDYCWSANKDWKGPQLPGTRLPNVSNGLNGFQDFRHVVFLSANNAKPPHIAFLSEKLGISASAVCLPFHKQNAYQAVMRGALRTVSDDGQNSQPMSVFVADSETAIYLQKLFPGSNLEYLNAGIDDDVKKVKGRQPIHATNADKTAACRKRQQLDTEAEIERIRLCQSSNESCPRMIEDLCNDKAITYRNFVTQFRGSIWRNHYERHPKTVAVYPNDKCFVKFLEAEHQREAATKDAVELISPALFNPENAETYRGKANIVFLKNIWLDFEGGDFLPPDFASLFPYWQFVAMSSYRSTREDIRYHICILTDPIIASSEAYEAITHHIRKVIEDNGFPLAKRRIDHDAKAHGIDGSKLNAASLFKHPCKGPDESGWFFFKRISGGRKPLNVYKMLQEIASIASSFSVLETVGMPLDHRDRSETVCDSISTFEMYGTSKGQGDIQLYILGMNLIRLGVPASDAKAILLAAAAKTTSPKDRRDQALRFMAKHY